MTVSIIWGLAVSPRASLQRFLDCAVMHMGKVDRNIVVVAAVDPWVTTFQAPVEDCISRCILYKTITHQNGGRIFDGIATQI